MKTTKLINLLLLFTFTMLVSCSSSSEDEGCIKTCENGFVLNEDNCGCEPMQCTTTCSDNEILNEDTCECEAFVANVVEVDAAKVTLTDDWVLRTTIDGYTGDGYVVWEGLGQTWKGTVGEKGQLEYKFTIPRPGTYLFQWRTYIAKKASTDAWAEHNDSWLKMLDADDFFAEKAGRKIYPKGSGKSPNPAGENGNGFFKIYMNDLDKWSTISSTSDNDAHLVYGTFNEAKEYTIIIAARSDYHAIDSFKLIEQNIKE